MNKKMNSNVMSQLEVANSALRKALTYSENENVYAIGNIVSALKEIDSAIFSGKMSSLEKPETEFLAENTLFSDPITKYEYPAGLIGDDVIKF